MKMKIPLALAIFSTTLTAADSSPFHAPDVAPEFREVQSTSLYLPMKDGTRLALDVLLPKDLPAGRKIPALFKITRYGRAPVDGRIGTQDRFWVQHGYARVLLDERGTGASFGAVRYGKATLDDLREVVDWVVKQPWSNGRVGAMGVSYEGTTAELLAATGHPAVRAVAPLFSDYDYYTDLMRPGGVFNDWIVRTFSTMTGQMDAGAAAKPVDGDTDGSLLKRAIASHGGNPDLFQSVRNAEFKDDVASALGGSYRDMSIPGAREQLEKSRVPMLILAGWMDAGTVQGTLERFRAFSNQQRVIIGAWSHGGLHFADPFAPSPNPDIDSRQQNLEALRFFDNLLKDASGAAGPERRLYYFTLGENAWKSTDSWPPAGFSTTTYYLAGEGALRNKPEGAAGAVRLAPVSTGEMNRWHTQLTGENVDYRAALPKMQTLASFTSLPLASAVEITGRPVLRLRLRTAETDPAVLAYLVALDPQNNSVYLTEGQLRLIHRKLDAAAPALHSYIQQDAQPVKAEDEMDAAIALLPLSALVPKGWRLEILLASGDTATFGTAPTYQATLLGSSRLELPAKKSAAKIAAPSPSAACADSKPNFTGTWLLNVAESRFPANGSVPDRLAHIVEQNCSRLRYKLEREQGGRRGGFDVELKIGGPAHVSDAAGVITAKWVDRTLVVTMLYNPGSEREVAQIENWVLSEDGKKVIDDTVVRQTSSNAETHIHRVFDKQE